MKVIEIFLNKMIFDHENFIYSNRLKFFFKDKGEKNGTTLIHERMRQHDQINVIEMLVGWY